MEDFSGVYDAVRDGDVPVSYTGFVATDLEIEQLQDASGPFLKITQNTEMQHIVAPQDIAQIRNFCDKTNGNSKDPALDEYCVRCRAHDTTTNSLSLSEKQVHLDLALRLLRHLNSPLFQRRFKLLPQRDTTPEGKQDEKCAPASTESNSALVRGRLTGPDVRFLHIEEERFLVGECASGPQKDHWQWSKLDLKDCLTNEWGKIRWAKAGNFVMSCRNIVLLNSTVMEAEASDVINWHRNVARLEERVCVVDGHLTFIHEKHGTGDASAEPGSGTKTSNHADESTSVAGLEDSASPSGHTDSTETSDYDFYDSDDSVEDEDHGEVDIIKKMRGQEQDIDEDTSDRSNDLRYEISQWPYHFRQADSLWSEEEKAGSQQWTELITELDKFAIDNVRAFELWQNCAEEGDYLQQGVGPLHVAATLGLTYWARHLVEIRGMDPSVFSEGRNALQAAAISADSHVGRDMLEFLLSTPGADAVTVGTSDPNEPSALQEWLSRDPSREAIKLFIDSNVHFTDFVLHFFAASKATDPDALKLILDSDGTVQRPRLDINAKDTSGNTPLHFLMARRDVPVELLKAFIAHGANVNAENDFSLRPLQSACSWSEPQLVKILLDGGISDINDKDADGLTALHAVASAGSTACVRLLLSHSADMSLESKNGRGALHLVAQNGHKHTVETLIDYGANLNDGDGHGRTPFWFACNGSSEETAAAMLAALRLRFSIVEINKPSRRGRTPLRMAVTRGFLQICEDLINMTAAAGLNVQARLNIRDTLKGSTALHRAAWVGEVACARLLRNNADATLKDFKGNTAIMLATDQWQMTGEVAFEEIVLCLVDKDQEQAKLNSNLPATAALNGSVCVLEKLHRIGADVNKPDPYGWTPLTLAKRLQYTDVERFLKHQTAWGGTLPSAWAPHTAITGLVEVSDNGLEIVHESGTQCTISTDKPLPAGLDRYYFEVTSQKLTADKEQPDNPFMGIGFCTLGAQYYEFPGWEPKRTFPLGRSWAYHGDDGGFFDGSSISPQPYGERYGPGDTIGCGVDLETRKIW
jgi:ankyrin repeat protein